MGQNTGVNSKGKKEEVKREDEEDEQDDDVEEEHEDDLSVHSSCKPASSANHKDDSEVELELKLLEALEIYPPTKLQGMHKHFVLFGLTEFLGKSFDRRFTSDEVLKLMDRFYNLDLLKPDEDEIELMNQEQEFSLPKSYFEDEDS